MESKVAQFREKLSGLSTEISDPWSHYVLLPDSLSNSKELHSTGKMLFGPLFLEQQSHILCSRVLKQSSEMK